MTEQIFKKSNKFHLQVVIAAVGLPLGGEPIGNLIAQWWQMSVYIDFAAIAFPEHDVCC